MEETEINYNYETVDMLLATLIIVKAFRDNIDFFEAMRTIWNPDFADALEERTENALTNLVGVNHKIKLKQATNRVMDILKDARTDLYSFKVHVKADFGKEEAAEILDQLGYNRFYRDIQDKNNQENLMSMLNNFRNVMNDGLKEKIVAVGINPGFIERISGYAPEFQQANIEQEKLKNFWNQPSQEASREYKSIYGEIIRICKIGAAIFKDDPEKRDLFIFSRVVAKVSSGRTSQETEPDAEAPAEEE